MSIGIGASWMVVGLLLGVDGCIRRINFEDSIREYAIFCEP